MLYNQIVPTPAAVLAALDGQTLTGDIQLADTSAVVKPAGRLGGTTDGIGLVVHDGVRTGGRPVPVGFDDVNLRTATLVPNALIVAGDAIVEIGRFKLPDALYVNGQILYVAAEILVNGSSYAGSEISLGLHFDGQTDLISAFDKGVRLFVIGANFSANQRVSALGNLLVTDASDIFQITAGDVLAGVRCPVGAANGSLASTVAGALPDSGCVTGGDLVLTARVGQDAAMSGNPIYISTNAKVYA